MNLFASETRYVGQLQQGSMSHIKSATLKRRWCKPRRQQAGGQEKGRRQKGCSEEEAYSKEHLFENPYQVLNENVTEQIEKEFKVKTNEK